MSRKSYFTGKLGVFNAKYRGVRATLQSGTKTIVVRCHCPEATWEKYKPLFEEIINSIAPGLVA